MSSCKVFWRCQAGFFIFIAVEAKQTGSFKRHRWCGLLCSDIRAFLLFVFCLSVSLLESFCLPFNCWSWDPDHWIEDYARVKLGVVEGVQAQMGLDVGTKGWMQHKGPPGRMSPLTLAFVVPIFYHIHCWRAFWSCKGSRVSTFIWKICEYLHCKITTRMDAKLCKRASFKFSIWEAD